MNPPFFILGFGRSGTTLLASMLSMSPNIYIPPELKGLYTFEKRYKYFGDLTKEFNLKLLYNNLCQLHQLKKFDMKLDENRFLEKLKNKDKTGKSIIESFYETLLETSGKKRLGDKTIRHTLNLDVINELFPDAKIIHVVRDGRDCALSHRKISSDYNVFLSAKRWKKFNKALENFGHKNKARYLFIKYEDLISKPKDILTEVCLFLEEPFSEQLLNYSNSSYARTNSKFMSKQHSNLKANINKDNFNKWLTGLSSDEIKIFECIAGKILNKYGYNTKNNFDGFHWRILKFYYYLLKKFYDVKKLKYPLNYMIYIYLKRIFQVQKLRNVFTKSC